MMNFSESEYSSVTFEATYSAEDNKLRLYASDRMDEETYHRAKKLGFKWAPRQELFVAPKWTPQREDFCIELAGEITAEQSTLVERAEAKAERLDTLAEKRQQQANAFHESANRIAERFHGGQPILVGHHSEKGARRDKEKIDRAMQKAVKAQKAVNYWNYKAEGVERHANYKNSFGVRSRRIKTLLADLRNWQRDINHAHMCQILWTKILEKSGDEDRFNGLVRSYAGAQLSTGEAAPWTYCGELREEKITNKEFVDKTLQNCEKVINSQNTNRWINHILNRLGFERSELGPVSEYTGKLTGPIVQGFAREFGAHKPKATKTDTGWLFTSVIPLPLHLGDGKNLELTDDNWVKLMQSSGYEVPAKRPSKPSILNFRASELTGKMWSQLREFSQIELTKAEYSKIYKDYRGVAISECGQFRFKVCKDPNSSGYDAAWFAVFLSDSKVHEAPKTMEV